MPTLQNPSKGGGVKTWNHSSLRDKNELFIDHFTALNIKNINCSTQAKQFFHFIVTELIFVIAIMIFYCKGVQSRDRGAPFRGDLSREELKCIFRISTLHGGCVLSVVIFCQPFFFAFL